MTAKRNPFEKIQQKILDQKIIPTDLIPLLPQRWKRVGNVGILTLKTQLLEWKQEIGKIYLENIPELRTIAHKKGITHNKTRMPDYEVIAGEKNTVTLHRELACKFWLDALKLTFSNGNHAERQRMARVSKDQEQIIDMFCCVGNLSLPIAVHNPTVKIIGIEINSCAFKFLEKNIKENHLTNRYKALLGDNRKITPKNWADRVIMGYFTIDNIQLTNALASLKQKQGGIIHAHGLTSDRQPKDWRAQIESLIKESFPHFRISSTRKKIIKSVAPGINHFVNDFKIEYTQV